MVWVWAGGRDEELIASTMSFADSPKCLNFEQVQFEKSKSSQNQTSRELWKKTVSLTTSWRAGDFLSSADLVGSITAYQASHQNTVGLFHVQTEVDGDGMYCE